MFRVVQKFVDSPVEKTKKVRESQTQLNGSIRIEKKITYEFEEPTENFDKYSLKDLIATGKKIEQVNTKVIDVSGVSLSEGLDNVPRETSKEETPF